MECNLQCQLYAFNRHTIQHLDGQKVKQIDQSPATTAGLSKGVGFVRFDQRMEAERAIKQLHNTIPEGASEPITVKFANNPSNNAKALVPLAAYLSPQRRFAGPIHHPANRFRYIPLSPISRFEGASVQHQQSVANSRSPGYDTVVRCPCLRYLVVGNSLSSFFFPTNPTFRHCLHLSSFQSLIFTIFHPLTI